MIIEEKVFEFGNHPYLTSPEDNFKKITSRKYSGKFISDL
jgi:hypothetical protein